MDPVTELLVACAMAAVAGLLLMALAIGAAVAIRPDWLQTLRARAERRVSTRRLTEPLDRPRIVDHIFYRHHRAYGAVVVVLAVFLLYFLVFGQMQPGWNVVLGIENQAVAEILATTASFVLWLAALFALIVGTIVFVRPSALKGMERWANRWLTPRRLTRPAEGEYYLLETWASSHPKIWGSVMAGASLICLVALYVQYRMSGLAG